MAAAEEPPSALADPLGQVGAGAGGLLRCSRGRQMAEKGVQPVISGSTRRRQQQQSNRFKLSRELMLRLNSALSSHERARRVDDDDGEEDDKERERRDTAKAPQPEDRDDNVPSETVLKSCDRNKKTRAASRVTRLSGVAVFGPPSIINGSQRPASVVASNMTPPNSRSGRQSAADADGLTTTATTSATMKRALFAAACRQGGSETQLARQRQQVAPIDNRCSSARSDGEDDDDDDDDDDESTGEGATSGRPNNNGIFEYLIAHHKRAAMAVATTDSRRTKLDCLICETRSQFSGGELLARRSRSSCLRCGCCRRCYYYYYCCCCCCYRRGIKSAHKLRLIASSKTTHNGRHRAQNLARATPTTTTKTKPSHYDYCYYHANELASEPAAADNNVILVGFCVVCEIREIIVTCCLSWLLGRGPSLSMPMSSASASPLPSFGRVLFIVDVDDSKAPNCQLELGRILVVVVVAGCESAHELGTAANRESRYNGFQAKRAVVYARCRLTATPSAAQIEDGGGETMTTTSGRSLPLSRAFIGACGSGASDTVQVRQDDFMTEGAATAAAQRAAKTRTGIRRRPVAASMTKTSNEGARRLRVRPAHQRNHKTTARRAAAGHTEAAASSLVTNERVTSINLIIRERQRRLQLQLQLQQQQRRQRRRKEERACNSIESIWEADHFYDHHQQHNLDYLFSSCFGPCKLNENQATTTTTRARRREQHPQAWQTASTRRRELKRRDRADGSEAGSQVQGCCPDVIEPTTTEASKLNARPPKTVIDSTTPKKEQEGRCRRRAELGGAHSQLLSSPSKRPMNSPLSCDSFRLTDKISRLKDGRDFFLYNKPKTGSLGGPRAWPKCAPEPKRDRPGALNLFRLVLICLLALVASFDLSMVPARVSSSGRFITPSSALPADRLAQHSQSMSNATAATTRRPDKPQSGRSTLAGDELSTDEFSKAVLATMSTQSSLSADLANTTRPLAMAQGGYRPSSLEELETSASDEHELEPRLSQDGEQPASMGSRSTPATSSTLANTEMNHTAPNGAQLGGNSGKLDELLGNLTEFARIFAMVAIMIGDICGNSLVILSVVRHSKLRVTTNWFVVSLACADILVALFAMTFNASVQITGRWIFPRWMCDFWNSCDVLASTASILHLCCISIDRYYAIMRPLDYPMKITTRRVCYALAVVWISSALLSYIPIFTGIYTTSEHTIWQQANPDQCEFVVNRVYAIVSSSISFWIPCCIMVFTYWRIYEEATRQEKFIYKAQNMLPAPQSNHSNNRAKQHRSKSMAVTSLTSAAGPADKSMGAGSGDQASKIKQLAKRTIGELKADEPVANSSQLLANSNSTAAVATAEQQPLTGSTINLNNNNNNKQGKPAALAGKSSKQQQQQDDQDERDSNSGQSTPTKRSISKMKREHKAAKTLGIIMGVFILCWLPFFSWYTPVHICGHLCDGMIPKNVVTLLFWIGYFNSTLNPIIYAYFNHEFRDAFKKTLQWIFCCCRDLKCLRVNRPNDNQHYNCTYRSTQEIGLVTNG